MQLKGWNTYYAESCSKSWPKGGRKMLQKGQVVINILWMHLCAVLFLNNFSFPISSKSLWPMHFVCAQYLFFWKFGQVALEWADSLEVHFQVLELFCFWCHWNYTSSWKEGDVYGTYGMATKGTCSEKTWLKVCAGGGAASWELLYLPAVCTAPTTIILWNCFGRSQPEG